MVFNCLAQAIIRMVARRGYTVPAYLDEFVIIKPIQSLCKVTFDTLSLGFTVNWSKIVYSAQCLIFLEVEIDTVQFALCL